MSDFSLISVIVPIYNVERYLHKCLDSIIAQTYVNIEIILVDDGSPDRSGVICDEYATKDERIRVIHQANGGVVRARNAGLAIARGKYLSFVDADDWLELDMLEVLVKSAETEQAQIVWCDWVEDEVSGGKAVVAANFDPSPEVMLQRLFLDKAKGYLWNKLLRKDFYDGCRVRVDATCTMMEDKYMVMQFLCALPRMSYVPQVLYHYVLRSDSAVGQSGISPLVKGAPNVRHMYDFLQEKGLLQRYEDEFFRYAMQVKFAFVDVGKMREGQQFIPEAHKSLRHYPVSGMVKWLYWLCFNTGKLGADMLKLYKKL